MVEKYDILHRIEHLPSYGLLILTLKPEQKVWVESSAIAASDPVIIRQDNPYSSKLKELQQNLAEISLCLSEFTIGNHKGDLYVTPALPGAIRHYYVKQKRGLMIQSSCFLACSEGVNIESKFADIKSFFGGESIFLLKTVGRGDLWFSAYGSIIEVEVSGDHVVDTGYVVAFEESLSYRLEKMRNLSLKTVDKNLFGCEGLVCRFQGQGKLWLQCRQLSSLINFVKPLTRLI